MLRLVAESYEQRIEDAERMVAEAKLRRDTKYPGSVDWEAENEKVKEWESALRELRRRAYGD